MKNRGIRKNAWLKKYNLLKDYVLKKGEIPIKNTFFQGIKLGFWCRTQKMKYKQKKISQERIELLEKIEGWKWTVRRQIWEEAFHALKKYINLNNKLPDKKTIFEGYNLGWWCDNRRREYKKGLLSKDRIKKLESLDYWFWHRSEVLNDLWEKNYQKLKNLSSKYKLHLQKSGWCQYQRESYKKNKLSKEKIKKLERIPGWCWNLKDKIEDKWEEKYNLLVRYVKKYKKLPTQFTVYQDVRIGKWADSQRFFYRKGKLSKERTSLLNKIKGWVWNIKYVKNKRNKKKYFLLG